MLNNENENMNEALAVDGNGDDVYGRAQTVLLKKLVSTKMQFGFMKEIDAKIREAVGNTADFFDKNDISNEVQEEWLKFVELFAQIVNAIGMIATSYSASRTKDGNLEKFKSNALSHFQSSDFNKIANQRLNDLSSKGVKMDEYAQILSSAPGNIINQVFNLNSDNLVRFISFLNVNPNVKDKILKTIESKKGMFTSPGNAATVATPKQAQQQVDPELQKIIAGNFTGYIAKIKQRFGIDGLAAMKKAIEVEMTKP